MHQGAVFHSKFINYYGRSSTLQCFVKAKRFAILHPRQSVVYSVSYNNFFCVYECVTNEILQQSLSATQNRLCRCAVCELYNRRVLQTLLCTLYGQLFCSVRGMVFMYLPVVSKHMTVAFRNQAWLWASSQFPPLP